MGPLLAVVNAAFAAFAALVVWRWRRARAAAEPVDPEGTVTIRLRQRPFEEDEVDRWVRRSLAATTLVPAGGRLWGDRDGAAARVTPPALGDRATLVEVSARRADAVVAGLVDQLLEDGYVVRRRRGRVVQLRRGPERVSIEVATV